MKMIILVKKNRIKKKDKENKMQMNKKIFKKKYKN